jgi:anionic cell wall polymer biosynthesis LytR-Cps2A-Psr (LCP) family protein
VLFGIVILSIVCFIVANVVDKQILSREEEEALSNGVIEYKGERYVPKKNIETYLFIGVDSMDKVKKAEDYGESGQNDFLLLMVRDISDGTFKTLSINRNTMTNVKSLDLDGSYLGEGILQIALAHASGDGMEDSCENTVDAVSELLGGQTIDGYAAVNMGAISIINNLAGGVTVTIEDDFSKTDPSLKMGETVTLTDEQAVHFVHDRWYVGDETNENRMKRQSQYMENLKVKLKEKCQADNSYPLDIYDALGDYMVTNITSQKFAKLALLVIKDKDEGSLTIDGTVGLDEYECATFEADEDSLEETIIELFYKKYN